MSDTTGKQPDDHSERDAASLRVLGLFFAILGLLVLVGTFWAAGSLRATVVNIGSGAVLVAVAVGMLAAAKRIGRRKAGESVPRQPAAAEEAEMIDDE